MTILYSIRHGETTGDLEDRYGGSYDDELSLTGQQQAVELAEELQGRGIARVYASTLQRAQQTGGKLANVLGCPLVLRADLCERDQYGAITGLTKAEALARFPDLVAAAKDRNNTLPNGESYTAFSTRIQRAFAEIAAKGENAAIVWHGGCQRVLFRDILKIGELAKIGDCCWTQLEGGPQLWRPVQFMRLEIRPPQ